MARRLGIIMWRMLITGEPYRGLPEESEQQAQQTA